MNIFYVPVTNKYSLKNLNNSVVKCVSYNEIPIKKIIDNIEIQNNVGVWGFKSGKHNDREYNSINKGDIIFFRIKDENGYAAMDGFGVIGEKIVSKDISMKVWGDNSYQNIILIDKYIRFSKPFRLLEGSIKVASIDGVPDSVWHDGYNMFRQWNIANKEIEEEEFIGKILKAVDNKELYNNITNFEDEVNYIESNQIEETEKDSIVKLRIGQGAFKRKLLIRENYCKICGLNNERLLIASHIKPWKESNNRERLDENNGFLLCPSHDAIFDKFLITFQNTGEIIISETLSKIDAIKLNINDTIKIKLEKNNLPYIEWHRNNFYIKENERVKITEKDIEYV